MAVYLPDGNDVTLGSKGDSAQVDPTQSASVVAILKGIQTELVDIEAQTTLTPTVSGTVTANAGTGPFPTAGMVASGSSNANNPVKTGGVFNTTQPTVTNGQVVDAQYTARGAAIVSTGIDTFNVTVNAALPAGSAVIGSTTIQATSGTALTADQSNSILKTSLYVKKSANADTVLALGSATSANSMPVVIASDQGAVAIGVASGTALAADQSNTILKSSLYVKKSANADTVLALGSATSANSMPVVIASDQGAFPVTQSSGPWTANVTQFGGNNVATGTGASGTGIPRVTVSNDSQVQVWDGTRGPVTVKAANTSPLLADLAAVYALSPNNTGLPVNLPSIVQKTNNVSSGSVASLAKAFVSNNVGGNSIIVVCSVGNGTAPTISDTNSNTYTQAVQIANSTTLNVAVFYAVNIASGANTITINNGGSTASIAMEIYEVSGLITQVTAQPDQTASLTGTSGTAATASISALFPNEYAFAGVGIGTAAQTITVGSGWTNDSGQQNPTTPAGLFSFVSMSQFLGSFKGVTPQATFTSEPWAIAVATFKSVVIPTFGPAVLYGTNNTVGDTAIAASGAGLLKTTANMQINNTIVAAGNGVTNAQTMRVTLSSDSTGQVALAAGAAVIGALTANQSVNVAQVAGGATSNAGQTGALQVGGAVATNNNVSSATNPLLIAGSDYGGTPKVQSLKVDSSGNAQANVSQFGGSAVATGTGAGGSGIPRVTVSNDSNVLSTQSGTWTVQPGNTPNSTAWLVQAVAGTSGGSTPYHLLSANSNNATSLKASAGLVYGYSISNTNASARWVKFYDKASAPAPASDTVKWAEQIPGNATVLAAFPEGMTFSTGIAFAAVVNASDTDNTSVGASDLSIDIRYK